MEKNEINGITVNIVQSKISETEDINSGTEPAEKISKVDEKKSDALKTIKKSAVVAEDKNPGQQEIMETEKTISALSTETVSSDISTGIRKLPVPMSAIKAVYPPEAKRNGIQGTVLLQLQIQADGTLSEVLIEKSSGFKILDKAALRSVKSCLFEPGTVDGIPIISSISIEIQFKLKD